MRVGARREHGGGHTHGERRTLLDASDVSDIIQSCEHWIVELRWPTSLPSIFTGEKRGSTAYSGIWVRQSNAFALCGTDIDWLKKCSRACSPSLHPGPDYSN